MISTSVLLVIGLITTAISYRCVSSLSDKCPDPVLRNSLLFLTVLGAVLTSVSATMLYACGKNCGSRGNLELVFGVLWVILITSSIAYSKYDCDSDRKKDLSVLLGITILGIAMCGSVLFIKYTEKPSVSVPGKFGYRPANMREFQNAPLPPVHPVRLNSLHALKNAPQAPTSRPGSLSVLASAPRPPAGPVRKRG